VPHHPTLTATIRVWLTKPMFSQWDGKTGKGGGGGGSVYTGCRVCTIGTSGPFGDTMSAAARPKRWGVSRQAKGREIDSNGVEYFTLPA
jgi:hypothetical protein